MERIAPPVFLAEGDLVAEGSEPIRCAAPHPKRQGWQCRGFVGLPEPGAMLLKVFERDDYIGSAQRGLWALRCPECGRSYIFRAPVVDSADQSARLHKVA